MHTPNLTQAQRMRQIGFFLSHLLETQNCPYKPLTVLLRGSFAPLRHKQAHHSLQQGRGLLSFFPLGILNAVPRAKDRLWPAFQTAFSQR